MVLSLISAGLRYSRPYFSPLWLHDGSLRCPQSCFCLRSLKHTEAQGFLRSFAQGSSQPSPNLLCHRVELRRVWESSLLFSAQSCSHHRRISVDSEFSTGGCRVLFWKLISIQLWFTRQDVLLFQSGILASHLTILSTPGHPSRTGAPHVAVVLPSWRYACNHPVAPSSPSRRPIRLQRTVCSPSVA